MSLWPNLTGGEVIDLLGALRGGLDRARRADLIERFQLDPTKKCRAYSKGNRQKVALVAAFASDVELYLLDEPTSGLDPLMMTVFQDVVRERHAAGRTVLLSSHILSEVEALCDHLTIIRAGRTADTGAFDELRHLTRTTVVVETARPLDGLAELPGVYDAAIDGDPGRVLRRARRPQPRAGAPRRARRARADDLAAHARGALPAPLRGSRPPATRPEARADAVPDGGGGMNAFAGTSRLIRLAAAPRPDRARLPG